MKKKCLIGMLVWLLFIPGRGYSQAQEIQQLLLNIEKLTQFKAILSDMKKGYEILTKGYKGVKDMTEGNFSLHKTFLDALMQVSPTVKNYKRVGDIINYQILVVKESKTALARFSKNKNFTGSELKYFENVYRNLTKESLKNLEELTTILTAGQLKMTDDERLEAIDKIYASMQDKIQFMRDFNSSSSVLILQRNKEKNDVNAIRDLHSLKD